MRFSLALVGLVFVGCAQHPSPPTPTYEEVCGSIDCGRGRCVVADGAAACACDAEYLADGLSCVPAGTCSPNPCAATTHPACVDVDGGALCRCAPGLSDLSGTCAAATPCSAIPCVAPHQSVCIDESAGFRCECDAPFVLTNGRCVPPSTQTCPGQHAGGDEDPYEPDECPALASVLVATTAGSHSQGHTLAPAGDVDWIRLKTTAEHVYELRVMPTAPPAPVLTLMDSQQTAVITTAADPYTGGVRFTSATGADYLVKLSAPANDARPIHYSFQAVDLGRDDHGSTNATATVLALPARVDGYMRDRDDVDVFQFAAVAGRDYEVRFAPTNLSVVTTTMEIKTSAGAPLFTASATQMYPVVAAPSTGPLYVTLKSPSQGNLRYVLLVEDVGVDDYPDTTAAATSFPPGFPTSVTGVRHLGTDWDYFSFNATQGFSYRISCASGAIEQDRICWPRVSNASGFSLDGNPSKTTISFTAPSTGQYFVAPYALQPGPYRLELAEFRNDDHGNTVATATVVLDGGVSGSLETTTDEDVFRVSGAPGHFHAFACTSDDLPFFMLAGLSSSGVFGAARSVPPWRVIGKGEPDGRTYFVARLPDFPGSYRCATTDLGPDDHASTFAAASSISPDVAVSGRLEEAADVDALAVAATARNVYRVYCRLGQQASGFACRAATATGASLGALTPTNYVTVLADGPFYVEARSVGAPAFSTYSVLAQTIGVDSEPDSRLTATVLAIPSPVTAGRAETARDLDVFRLDALNAHEYELRLTGAATARMTASDGTVLGVGQSLVVEPIGNTTYYFEVFTSSADVASYTYELIDYGVDDHGDNQATATMVSAPTGTVAANFHSPYDVDVFRFSATASTPYRVSCDGGCSSIIVRSLQPSTIASGSRVADFQVTAAQELTAELRGDAGGYAFSIETTDGGSP